MDQISFTPNNHYNNATHCRGRRALFYSLYYSNLTFIIYVSCVYVCLRIV